MDATPILLQTAFDQGEQNGFATLYIQISNADGTAPTLAVKPGNPNILALTQPVANPGADPSFPADQFPYVGVIAATGTGTADVDLVSDGVVNQIFAVTVTTGPAQTATVPAGAIVITPPG
jgi:hypothetical protein